MDVENIFRDVKLSKTEMTVLRFIQNDPEQCIRQEFALWPNSATATPLPWSGWRKN